MGEVSVSGFDGSSKSSQRGTDAETRRAMAVARLALGAREVRLTAAGPGWVAEAMPGVGKAHNLASGRGDLPPCDEAYEEAVRAAYGIPVATGIGFTPLEAIADMMSTVPA